MPQVGYVYIVHGKGTRYIKIGQTTNVFKRLRDLQNGVPFSLQLISVQLVSDTDATEAALLAEYAQYRSRGEWFELPSDVLMQWPLEAALVPVVAEDGDGPPVKRQPFSTLEAKQILGLFDTHDILELSAIYEAMEATTQKEKNRIKIQLYRLVQKHRLAKTTRGMFCTLTYTGAPEDARARDI